MHPFANSLLEFPDSPEKRYPLTMTFCEDCHHVQLTYTADPSDLFSHYVWVTGTSKGTTEYSNIFCEKVLKRINIDRESYVLEIASNDGTFLKPFIEKGINVLGVDPAANIAQIANARGIPTHVAFFNETFVADLSSSKGPAKVAIARNVFPHVANINNFTQGFANILTEDGIGVVEIHYAGHIVEGLQYDSVYHEHLGYFTLETVEFLFNKHGLYVFDIEESPISGGSLVLYLDRNIRKASSTVAKYQHKEAAAGLNDFDTWVGFANKAREHKMQFNKTLKKYRDTGKIVVGYGASARSSTLLNYCGINSEFIRVIADQNQFKHNKYTAGSHIPIMPPEEVMKIGPDIVVILGWNFAAEIIDVLSHHYNYKNKVLLPLPGEIIEREL
jgi:SAM-dependent methyltransferase